MENFLLWERSHAGAGAESEEEGVAEMCDELTATPIPCTLVLLKGRRWRELGVRLSPGRREGRGECAFKICSYFSLSYSDVNRQ